MHDSRKADGNMKFVLVKEMETSSKRKKDNFRKVVEVTRMEKHLLTKKKYISFG